MLSTHGIKLAVSIISSSFGDIVAKVCECLLRKGTLPLAQIVHHTELDSVNVKNSLLVLIQHNCVQAFAVQQEGGFGVMPKELGKECEEIFEALLQHGRLSLKQIMERHKQTTNQSGGNCTFDALQESFNKLVNAQYVERCPAHEPFLAPPAEEETVAKNRAAKSAKMAAELETIEQRALAAAAPMESVRFLLEADSWADVSGEKKEENPTSVPVGMKRKHSSVESDTKVLAINGQKEVLWRVNFDQLIRCLRHEACVATVRSQFDDRAAIVVSAILEATRNAETIVKMENSVPISVNTIFGRVMKSEEGHSVTLEHVRSSLVQLGCDLPTIGQDGTYSIDLKKIIDRARSDEVESLVLKRFGREAYRIFRLLSKAGHLLETDKISNTTFVVKRDTLKNLYKLWKDDYLHMERMLMPGGNGMNVRFLLWKVNEQSLWEHVLDEMYRAALNMRLRIAHEQEQENEILQIPREKLVGDVGKRYIRFRKVRNVLISSLMKLDDALMLFHDF